MVAIWDGRRPARIVTHPAPNQRSSHTRTRRGATTLRDARVVHHRGIQEHFVEHLSAPELASLADALEAVGEHVRPLRPGRISSS
jgi:hypothetical protein